MPRPGLTAVALLAAIMSERAFWVVEPGRGEIRAASSPGGGDAGAVHVLARFSGISRGTESLVFQGRVPISLREAMRCPFQEGDFPAPVKYGYTSVGVTEAGERVFCLFPHQGRYAVPASALHRIPETVPDQRAVLAANMETALNALWDGGPRAGDRIAVIGAGVVGCMVARLCAGIPGTAVQLSDTNPARAAVADALGVALRSPEEVGGDNDLVFHASGSDRGLATALACAGFEATVLELSWYGDLPASVPLGENFHAGRLTLKASQVGHVAAARRPRRSVRDRMRTALEFLADPVFDCLLTGTSRFEDLPDTMKTLSHDPGDTLCHVIAYQSEAR